MAIIKETEITSVGVAGKYKHVQVATATVIKEDGVEISRSLHRKVLECTKGIIDGSGNVTFTDTDISGEHADVQAICNTAWTDEVKTSWKDFETGRMQTRRTEWLAAQG